MADVQALVWRISVMPDLVTRAGIDSPDIVRHSEIQNAIHEQRRRLDGGRLVGLEDPGQAQPPDILRSDSREFTVAPAGVIAVIAGPGIDRRVLQGSLGQFLAQQQAGAAERQSGSCGKGKYVLKRHGSTGNPSGY